MINMDVEYEYATSAFFKYKILSSFSTFLLLLSFCKFYQLTGSTNKKEIVICISYLDCDYSNLLILELGKNFKLIGFLFKLNIFPLHKWVPDKKLS
jgi:NADH:ubiquinone oxidoreductase subunit 2 (subunit N)